MHSQDGVKQACANASDSSGGGTMPCPTNPEATKRLSSNGNVHPSCVPSPSRHTHTHACTRTDACTRTHTHACATTTRAQSKLEQLMNNLTLHRTFTFYEALSLTNAFSPHQGVLSWERAWWVRISRFCSRMDLSCIIEYAMT